ncbi:MAG: RrF2 family transcriptional regulator [Hyphomicrobiaceae bacterium]
MRLSKQTTDAVRILVYCTRERHGLTKVASVAEVTELPRPLALKLVNILSRLGLLETVRGPRGGIRLACNPAEVTLGALVRQLEAFQGPQDGKDGVGEDGLSSFVDDAFEAFLSVLDRHTLADMASRNTSPLLAERPVTPEAGDSEVAGLDPLKPEGVRSRSVAKRLRRDRNAAPQGR